MKYKVRDGAHIKGDPQVIGEELETIEKKTAESVLAYAVDHPDSEIALNFEWDRDKAAMEHNLSLARCLLRSIVAVVVVSDHERNGSNMEIAVRAFESVSVKDSSEKVYVPIEEALADVEMREQVLGRLYETISEAQATAKKYSYLCPLLIRTSLKLEEAKATIR